MIQLDQELINGIGGGAGGIGVGGLIVWLFTKYGLPGKKSGNGNGSKLTAVAEQVNEIHGWYGDRGPMDRMTQQMEAVSENTKATTGVLEKILVVLEKD